MAETQHRALAMDQLRCGRRIARRPTHEAGFLTYQFAMVWFASGSGSLAIAGQSWKLSAGQAFKRPPGRRHRVDYAAGSQVHWLAVPAVCQDLCAICELPGHEEIVIDPGPDAAIASSFAHIERTLLRAHGVQRLRVLTRMLDLIGDLHERSQARDPQRGFLARACALLERTPHQAIPAVATACGIPYSSFRLRFQEAMGCSPLRWRIRRRIDQAQRRLRDGDDSLAAIAAELGYPDVQRFTTQFHQEVGVSPGRWRTRQRKG